MIKKQKSAPILVSASSCIVTIGNGKPKKVLGAIDCNRNTPGITLGENPAHIEILFSTDITWIDATVHNDHYSGKISLEGMGFYSGDIIPQFDPELKKHTVRFYLPSPDDGKLTIKATGGTGLITLWDISGFIDKPL